MTITFPKLILAPPFSKLAQPAWQTTKPDYKKKNIYFKNIFYAYPNYPIKYSSVLHISLN